jgi:hypothetical protein
MLDIHSIAAGKAYVKSFSGPNVRLTGAPRCCGRPVEQRVRACFCKK